MDTDKNGNGHTTSTALAIRGELLPPSPYEPRSYTEAQAMAKDFVESNLTKVRTQAQALLIMATGRELGIPATTALRSIHVIENIPALSADLMVALCLRSNRCEYFDAVDEECDEKRAVYVTRRVGRPERRQAFTIEEAQRAGLIKDGSNWKKYPAIMLRHRASSILARKVFPDILAGFYDPDEAREIAESHTGELPPVEVRPLTPEPEKPPAETADERAARWEQALRTATSEPQARAVVAEITATIADPKDPTRKALAALFTERKKAGFSAENLDAEPDHDPATGEVKE